MSGERVLKIYTRMELGTLGIIEGDKKRMLECYVDGRLFRQRKTFDEYYVDDTNFSIELDLRDLQFLAESFRVTVLPDCVIISEQA